MGWLRKLFGRPPRFKYVGYPNKAAPLWVQYRNIAYKTGETVEVNEKEAAYLRNHSGFKEI